MVGSNISPPPTEYHQCLIGSLAVLLSKFVTARKLGIALFALLPVRLNDRLYRTPDLLYMSRQNADKRHDRYWDGADLVMEVTLRSTCQRDLVQKRREYTASHIPEYWIINTQGRVAHVLALKHGKYTELSPTESAAWLPHTCSKDSPSISLNSSTQPMQSATVGLPSSNLPVSSFEFRFSFVIRI
jgi:Uma2 family endonuclease